MLSHITAKTTDIKGCVLMKTAMVCLGIIATVIVVIAVGSHRYQERMTQEAFSMLPLKFSVTRTTTNSVGQPAATYIPVANGGETPYSTYCFIPSFVRIKNASIIQYAQVLYYYDAPTPDSQCVVVRKPSVLPKHVGPETAVCRPDQVTHPGTC